MKQLWPRFLVFSGVALLLAGGWGDHASACCPRVDRSNTPIILPRDSSLGAVALCEWSDHDFSGQHLNLADFKKRNLSCANFSKAFLMEATFRHAILTNANMQDVHMMGVDLRDANLSGADLRGADLREACLHRTFLNGAVYDDNTQFPKGFVPQRFGLVRK